jgi:hypothetical protein
MRHQIHQVTHTTLLVFNWQGPNEIEGSVSKNIMGEQSFKQKLANIEHNEQNWLLNLFLLNDSNLQTSDKKSK